MRKWLIRFLIDDKDAWALVESVVRYGEARHLSGVALGRALEKGAVKVTDVDFGILRTVDGDEYRVAHERACDAYGKLVNALEKLGLK